MPVPPVQCVYIAHNVYNPFLFRSCFEKKEAGERSRKKLAIDEVLSRRAEIGEGHDGDPSTFSE